MAEVNAAASALSDDMAAPTPQRPLVALSVDAGGFFSTLVGEHVQNITKGNMAGSTWMKPLAIESQRNATVARFDPDLGFVAAEAGPSAELHLFSAAAPAAFVPTSLVRPGHRLAGGSTTWSTSPMTT